MSLDGIGDAGAVSAAWQRVGKYYVRDRICEIDLERIVIIDLDHKLAAAGLGGHRQPRAVEIEHCCNAGVIEVGCQGV